MNPVILPDAETRQAAAESPAVGMILEAGAGTGKTTTLVRRIIEGVRQGIPLPRQVAITFTVKAAHELATRLRKELQSIHEPWTQAALHDLPSMRIGTIDGFVQQVLQAFPLESGISGQVAIVSKEALAREAQAWFVTVLPRWGSAPELAEAWDTLEGVGTRFRTVEKQLHDLALKTLQRGMAVQLVRPTETSQLIADWQRGPFAEAGGLFDPSSKLAPVARQNLDLLSNAAAILSDDPTVRVPSLVSMSTLGGAPAKPCRDAIKAAHSALEDVRQQLLYARIVPLLEQVIADAQRLAHRLEREGQLGFDAALRRLISLLTINPDVAAQVRSDLGAVMIDEFQDTSPDQVRLLELLAEGGQVPIFVVGDPKQSIYRFRGADLAGYRLFRNNAHGRLEFGQLVSNFRSQPAILELVNDLFRDALSQEDGYTPLASVIPTAGGSARMRGNVVTSSAELQESEAALVVRTVVEALTTPWQIRDGDAVRSARPHDIAVLYQSRSALRSLLPTLAALSIPFRVEGETASDAEDDVRGIVSLLRYLSLTHQDGDEVRAIARTAALMSLPIAGTIQHLGHPDREALLEARILQLPADLVDRLPSDAVRQVLETFHLDSLIGNSPRPHGVLNRQHALLDLTYSAESAGILTVRKFVEEWDAGLSSKWTEAPAPEVDDDSVRLMTVHAAKGLEFPITIVVGFSGKSRPPDAILALADGRVCVSPIGTGTDRISAPGRKDITDQERQEDESEGWRLLYVAATRARDHLVVSAFSHSRASSLSRALSGIGEPIDETEPLGRTPEVDAKSAAREPFGGG